MNGQWIGTYSGTNTGTLVADLDDVGTSYAGMVFVYDNNRGYPRTAAQVDLPKNQSRVSLRAPLQHMQRGNGEVLSRELSLIHI